MASMNKIGSDSSGIWTSARPFFEESAGGGGTAGEALKLSPNAGITMEAGDYTRPLLSSTRAVFGH